MVISKNGEMNRTARARRFRAAVTGATGAAAAVIIGFAATQARGDCTPRPLFQPIGVLNSDGWLSGSAAMGVSADGFNVVGYSLLFDGESTQAHAVRWNFVDGMYDLGVAPNGLPSSIASRVSNDGKSIAGSTGFLNGAWVELRNGAYWLQPTAPEQEMVVLPDVYQFQDVTADGLMMVGGTRLPNLPWAIMDQAFTWTAETGVVKLGTLPGGSYSWASAVSADGSIVVGFGDTPDHITPLMWTAETGLVQIPNMPDEPGQANGVSADGSTITGYSGAEAFRWTAATGAVSIGRLSNVSSAMGLDVSADGSVIVGTDFQGGGEKLAVNTAVIWDQAHGMRILRDVLIENGVDMENWWLQAATGVSDDGRTIVGYGNNPQGNMEGFLVKLQYAEDITDDGHVDIDDLFLVINSWGGCGPILCMADMDGNGEVDVDDLFRVINAWGGCSI